MRPPLRDLLARLGPVGEVARHRSGRPRRVVLRAAAGAERVAVIAAARALARCGASLAGARRAVETVLERGECTLTLPVVASDDALRDELEATGVDCRFGDAATKSQG